MESALRIRFEDATHRQLRERVPAVAEAAVLAITAEVPTYTGPLSGRTGRRIRSTVQTALAGLMDLSEGTASAGPYPRHPALGSWEDEGSAGAVSGAQPAGGPRPVAGSAAAAYALGRGEARSGRSMDALLAAYRVGARTSWQGLYRVAVAAGEPAVEIGRFAELVFAYIDELSAASAAGHSEELAVGGRLRARRREQLARSLLTGADESLLSAAAARCEWEPPGTLTAVLVSSQHLATMLGLLDARTLHLDDDAQPGEPAAGDASLPSGTAVLLVPDADGSGRGRLLGLLSGRSAVVGPSRPWLTVRGSYERALRTRRLRTRDAAPGSEPGAGPHVLTASDGAAGSVLDSDDILVELILGADPEALADLRAAVLAPLSGQSPAARRRLAQTLRAWLLHQGRRDAVAADLFVHPQTVRYRVTQLRALYGDSLEDPRTALALTLALAPGVPEDV